MYNPETEVSSQMSELFGEIRNLPPSLRVSILPGYACGGTSKGSTLEPKDSTEDLRIIQRTTEGSLKNTNPTTIQKGFK